MSDRTGALATLAIAAAVAGCAAAAPTPSAPTASGDTCRGLRFDADRPPEGCMAPRSERRVPPRDALRYRIVESPAVARSGAKTTFTLALENVSKAPLTIDLDDACLAWDTQARKGDVSTFASECGGLCGGPPGVLRLTLEPGGVVTKRVELDATMRRVEGDTCTERSLGPLPPGTYTMEITLPWTDPSPIPGNDQAVRSRAFETPVVVR